MGMTAVKAITKALTKGGRVVWDPPDRPRLFAPKNLHPALASDKETVWEVLRRAAIFREQAAQFIQDNRPIPILGLPDVLQVVGRCISCGEDLAGRRYRCPLCSLAVTIALEAVP